MFSKNLKYYRLKRNMSKKELAASAGVSPMSISYYENGKRMPSMEIIKKMANVLDVCVSNFLTNQNENLVFVHGEFRKSSRLSKKQQEYIKASVEEYMNRFFSVVDILGGEVLPKIPECHTLRILDDAEGNALKLRKHLRFAESGPVGNLVEILENSGILVYFCNVGNVAFSGINGKVNSRPYVVINQNMSPERIRSTLAHELAHIFFIWPDKMEEKEIENIETAVSEAFLFPGEDALRELGIHRSAVTKDMELICRKYGISMYLLARKAALCGIISSSAEKNFYMEAGRAGWKKNEPVRIEKEEPELFLQLVLRAVCEDEISVQKGAELLQEPFESVADQCFGVVG